MPPAGFRPIDYRPQPRRTRLETLNLRVRPVHRLAAWLMERLPPGRLRHLYVARLVLPLAYGAMNRGDFEAFAATYFTADMRSRFAGEPLPGMGPEFAGREAMVTAYQEWVGGWSELERVPVAYAERGDTLVVLSRQRGRGDASGIAIDTEVGQVYRLRGGLACEYVECRSWEEAIRVGGITQ